MDERRLELKVGALALVAVLIGGGLVVALVGLPGRDRFVVYADFAFAGGLPEGAAVKIAGVKVGRVRAVEFRPLARDGAGVAIPVRLTAEIDRSAAVALRADTSAAVGNQGALGESYLEVLPGKAEALLADGASVRGLDPPRLDVVIARFFSLLEGAATDEAFRNFLVAVAKLAGTLDELFAHNKEDLLALVRDLVETLDGAREAMKDVRAAAKGAAGLLASPEIKGIVSDVAVAAKSARADLPPLLADARELVQRLDKTAGGIAPEDLARVKGILQKADALATQIQKVSANADAILTALQKGEGTAGKILKDPQVYDDLRAMLADLKSHPWKFVWKD